MFIRRCGWHRRYYGHGKLLGVSGWHALTVTFSDGMCERCAVRAREEWGLPRIAIDAQPERAPQRWRAFPFATAAVAASVAVVVIGLTIGEHRDNSEVSGIVPDVATGGDRPGSAPETQQAQTMTSRERALASAPSAAPQVAAAPQQPEIAEAPDAPRVAARPVPRRGRVTRVSDRRESVSSVEHPDVLPASVAEAVSSRPEPAAAPRVSSSPIEARMLHPFSAPRIVENQAP